MENSMQSPFLLSLQMRYRETKHPALGNIVLEIKHNFFLLLRLAFSSIKHSQA